MLPKISAQYFLPGIICISGVTQLASITRRKHIDLPVFQGGKMKVDDIAGAWLWYWTVTPPFRDYVWLTYRVEM